MTTAQISSLLATSARRHQAEAELLELNRLCVRLGKAALADYNEGKISREMLMGLLADYRAKIAEFKSSK